MLIMINTAKFSVYQKQCYSNSDVNLIKCNIVFSAGVSVFNVMLSETLIQTTFCSQMFSLKQ